MGRARCAIQAGPAGNTGFGPKSCPNRHRRRPSGPKLEFICNGKINVVSKSEKVDLINYFKTEPPATAARTIDKSSRLPAYAQLADILRSCISQGEYPPGGRLPAESALAKTHGVSAMTARQAVSVLEEEGLVRRLQGKGTYVRKIGVSASSFGLEALGHTFADQDNLSVRIVKAAVKKSPGEEKVVLGIKANQPVIVVERVILHQNQPFALHLSYTKFDPQSPTVESMLDTVILTELIYQEGYSNFKRGVLHLMPTQLGEREAGLLNLETGKSVFRLEHLFYDFDNKPAAYGWYIVSHEKMPLVSKIGIWDE
jgi:GntR family transcriptional regulator